MKVSLHLAERLTSITRRALEIPSADWLRRWSKTLVAKVAAAGRQIGKDDLADLEDFARNRYGTNKSAEAAAASVAKDLLAAWDEHDRVHAAEKTIS